MNTNMRVRPKMNARLQVALPADEKQKLFEMAAERRLPVSEVIRRGIPLMMAQTA